MNITEVKVYKLADSKTLALVSIVIDNDFVVSGLKILDGKNGLWVAMPNRKDSKNEYHDIAFPITKEARQTIQQTVLDKYVPFSDLDTDRFTPPELDTKKKPRTGYDTVKIGDDEILPF